tara:strand:+ start:301 stop:2046 length:1746 start_codon:yes stop_codon:yes gene_type:complete
MLNPFFQQGSPSEQNLVQELINEQLKMYGVEVYYIPRQYLTKTTVIEEVIQSEFNNAYPIEAYVNNYDGYDGQGTLLSKFGIQDLDDLTLIISKDRYENYITPLIKDLPNIELATRPKEGDLIYFPYGDRLFEIKFVEHEQPFYQLQKNYVYELRCELYRYSTEVVNTGVSQIDDNFQDQGYIQTYKVLGIGETAAAYTRVVDGALNFFTFSDKGYGYTAPVTLGLSTAPSGGVDAAGIVTGRTTYGSGGEQFLTIQGVELTNPGSGYTVAPLVTFTGRTTGTGAAATVGIATEGAVGFVTVTDVGSNYSEEPTVTFDDPPPYRGVLYGSWSTEFYISNAGGSVTGSNGSGYSPGTYNLTGGSGSGATLTVTNSNGAITGATGGLSFANGGQDYEVGDVLLIDGGDQNSYIKVGLTTIRTPGPGTKATGRAILSNNTVTAVRITNPGAGYTVAPNITFGLPNQVGTGNFQFNETVTGSSGNTGIVKSWNVGTKELKVSNLTGDFINGETITGDISGAQHKIVILNTITDNPLISDNTYDVPEESTPVEEDNPSSSYDQNVDIQSEADDLIDFTERNPFGRV